MVTIIVGAQFGSEGKGLVIGHLAGSYQVHVRVGAANAGHTVYVNKEKHVLQQLPCAAYANPWAKLVLGAGAMISPGILDREIRENIAWRKAQGLPEMRLYIDRLAHAVTPHHIIQEQASDLAERIGSTSTIAKEGIGAAQAARVMRTDYEIAQYNVTLRELNTLIQWVDTVELLHEARILGNHILLEGTQGTGLSNTTGFYPYVTSRNTTASGIAADCGFGPKDIDQIIIIARTFPIRVAGPSGPFYNGSKEISWSDIGIDGEMERTTVTKKIRRVATFSVPQILHAARVNSATEIALTFVDYLTPELYGKGGYYSADEVDLFDNVSGLIDEIEKATVIPVTMLGTGPATVIDRSSKIEQSIVERLNS